MSNRTAYFLAFLLSITAALISLIYAPKGLLLTPSLLLMAGGCLIGMRN